MCYYFYKNIALCFVDALWTNFCGYSGQIVFPDFMTMFFNAFWTSFPCIFSFGFDADVKQETARANAYLYEAGPKNFYMNFRVFGTWVLLAFWHGFITWVIPYFAYAGGPQDADGKVMGMWWVSMLVGELVIK
jgi:magnesium-transporting ATPase (P-type)